jgi:hypothetical protein
VAVRNIKRCVYEGLEMPLPPGAGAGDVLFLRGHATEVAKETLEAGILAYQESREPIFSNSYL